MIKVLLLPSSDYLGHPFPQRYNQIFERLHDDEDIEVHVFNFNLFGKKKLKSKVILHDIDGFNIKNAGQYYLLNGFGHTSKLRKIILDEKIDVLVFSNLYVPLMYNILDSIQDLHVPIVFDVPDYYPTSAAGYLANVNTPFGKFITGTLETIFRYLLKKSSIVTVASYALVEYSEKIGLKNVVHIPNGISESFYKLRNGNKIRKELGFLDSDILVGYIGSIEFWLKIEPLLKGLSMAIEKGLPAKLFLVGKGIHTNYPEKVRKWINYYGLDEHTYWYDDFIEHNKVPEYMASLDLGTIPFDVKNLTAYYAAPNKLWEYASQMTSILCSPIPEARYNLDYVTITNTASQYTDAIQKYFDDDNDLKKKRISAREKALKMTWEESTKIMAETLKELVK